MRDTASRLSDNWAEEHVRDTNASAASLGAFLASNPTCLVSDAALLARLEPLGRERVHAASYDVLGEHNASLASFFICNATLELDGAA